MNLTFFGLCLACMGVSLAEGMLMNGLFKSAARQPDIIHNYVANDHGIALSKEHSCNPSDGICH